MSEPVFRPAREDDIPEIRRIAKDAWAPIYEGFRKVMGDDLWQNQHAGDPLEAKADQVESHFRNHPDRAFVTEADGNVVGFCTYQLSETGLGTIGNNAIDPTCQGRGLGGAMYHECLRRFREAGMKFAKVTTDQDEGHAAARRAYEKIGFKPLRLQVNYFMEL